MHTVEAQLKNSSINLFGLVEESIVDGDGIRLVVFVQGCPHACKGCHNPDSHSLQGGTVYSLWDIAQKAIKNPLLSGVTFSGGEPFLRYATELALLAQFVKSKGLNVWCYTGYTLEELKHLAITDASITHLLNEIDVLVEGRFIESQKSLLLKFRGSSNQRVIDLQAMRSNKTQDIIIKL